MCTADDTDVDGEALMPREETPVLDDTVLCVKCKKEACVFLRKKDSYCKDCLTAYVDHKCRSSLGKSKLMKPTDKVLVGFSGSPSSVVLLHILAKGKKQDDHKKLMYPIMFCYIDEVCDASLEKRKQIAETYKNFIESYGFEFHEAKLYFVAEPTTKSKYLSCLRSPTSREDLFAKLRLRTLINVAREFKCNKIFTAENQESIAVSILSKVALGISEQLPQQVGFLHNLKPLTVLRPMGEIDSSEISYYIQFNSLQTMERIDEVKTATIQNLTYGFIHGLQEEFPSTVSTIYRTGIKCGLTRKLDSKTVCILCDVAPIVGVAETPYSADDAMEFSKSVSQPGTSVDLLQHHIKKFEKTFCHSCLTFIKEMAPEVQEMFVRI